MTKKDYELIASAIKSNYDFAKEHSDQRPTPDFVITLLAKSMSEVLVTTNKKFDRDKFLTACGVSV